MSSTLSTKTMHILSVIAMHIEIHLNTPRKENKAIDQIINLASAKIMELREAININ